MADALLDGELVFMRSDPAMIYKPQFIIWVRRYAETQPKLQPVSDAITKILNAAQESPQVLGAVFFNTQTADILDGLIPTYQKLFIHEGGRA